MFSKRDGLSRRHLTILVVSGLALTTSAIGVHAQEGGFGNIFEQLFAPRPAAPPPVAATPAYGYDVQPYRPRRHNRTAQRPRTRYVSLPKAEDPDKITGKQPVDSKAIAADPGGAILKDETLRPGDIVVMPNGPKVFTGEPGKRHRAGDFEDVKHSRMVDRKTRGQLLAMMVPIGAMPAQEARKAMAKLRTLVPPNEVVSVEARNEAGQRVINPWTKAP